MRISSYLATFLLPLVLPPIVLAAKDDQNRNDATAPKPSIPERIEPPPIQPVRNHPPIKLPSLLELQTSPPRAQTYTPAAFKEATAKEKERDRQSEKERTRRRRQTQEEKDAYNKKKRERYAAKPEEERKEEREKKKRKKSGEKSG